MFNMKKASGDNAGYQLRIIYVAETNLYHLVGYVGFPGRTEEIEWEHDGGPLHFASIEEVINHISSMPTE